MWQLIMFCVGASQLQSVNVVCWFVEWTNTIGVSQDFIVKMYILVHVIWHHAVIIRYIAFINLLLS